MTILEIEGFLSICEHKTVSRAAEELYITQPSLSSRLKTLERELGGELFVRKKGSREMMLTTAGKEFYKLALQYKELIAQMHRVFAKQPHKLRVSSLNSLDTFLLPQVYDRFLQEHPEIELEIQNMDLTAASKSIHTGHTDIAFTTGKIHDSTLKQTLVFKEPMVFVCSKGLNLNLHVSLGDLLENQELYVEWSNDFIDWHDNALGDHHFKITVSIMAHIKQFLESKLCWSIVPASVAQGLIEDGNIKIVPTAFDLPSREVSLITAIDADKNIAVKYFYDCLKDIVLKYPQIEIKIT